MINLAWIKSTLQPEMHPNHYRLFYNLVCKYSEPNRYYHNILHISDMCKNLLEIEKKNPNLYEYRNIYRAIFYHDYILDKYPNNEKESAKYYSETFAKEFQLNPNPVSKLIISTNHFKVERNSLSKVEDLLLDLDLAILGTNNWDYSIYCYNIHKENPIQDFKEKRIEVLDHFLHRKYLYKTEHFKPLERQAQTNLRKELLELTNQ